MRFSEKRWRDAERLAEHAVALEPEYAYGWDLLGAARFLQDDASGALRAWNRINKPLLDSVAIAGLSRTRYALVAGTLGLSPNTVLTADDFRLAARRARQLPGASAARVTLRPEADGYATLDVAIAERQPPTDGWPSAIALTLVAAVTQAVNVQVPGWTGQGEMWSAGWSWRAHRPQTALGFRAPGVAGFPGIIDVDASWDAQTYAATAMREERLHGSLGLTDWASPDLRYAVDAAVDVWQIDDAVESRRRTLSFGATAERRLAGDRLALSATGRHFMGISGGGAFQQGALRAAFRSSPDAARLTHFVTAGVEVATARAPMALWSGAGEGLARPALLRAHPLLHDGIVAGPVFGRRVAHVTGELERHVARMSLVRLGMAGFVDAAAADRGLAGRTPLHVDLGVGVRVHVPGRHEVIRVDVARGLRDGRSAVTAGVIARPF